jgi:protein SCO1
MRDLAAFPPACRAMRFVSATLLAGALLPAPGTAGGAGSAPTASGESASAFRRTAVSYSVPDVALVRSDGAAVRLRHELDADGRPVILNFVFTTCGTICPVLTQSFRQVQTRLGPEASRVRMVSISIDPEHDTPARLREYAAKVDAGSQWSFYTGSLEASLAVQKAFDVFRGDKMNHPAVTFLRAAPGRPWVRLEGFPKAEEVVAEYHQLVRR